MTDYKHLRELAEAATPGLWVSAVTRQFAWVETVPEFDLHRFDIQAETVANVELKNDDAEYIAAANPQTMIALLNERDALQARIDKALKVTEGANLSGHHWMLREMRAALLSTPTENGENDG